MANKTSQAPLYQRQVGDDLEIPIVEGATGGIYNLDRLSHDAGQMAAKLQNVSERLYAANFESLARQTIDQISEKNKSDPAQLTKDFDAAFKGLTKDVSPFMHAEIKERYEILTRPYVAHATELKTRINTDRLKEQSLTVLNQSLNGLEHNASSMLSKNDAVSYEASRAAQLQMLTMDQMLSQTDENGHPLFSAEYRVKFREDSTQSLMKVGLERWFDDQPNKEAAMKAILSGEKKFKFYDQKGEVMREISPLDEMNAYEFDKTRDYMEREIEAQNRKAKEAVQLAHVQSFLNGDNLIDPKSTAMKKAINSHFEQAIAPQLSNLDDVEKANVISGYVEKVGLLPTSLQGQLRAITRNGNPEQQAFAADLISRIQEKSPMALDDMPEKDISYGLMMAQYLRYGMDTEEAIIRLEKQFDPLQRDVIDKRRGEFKEFEVNAEDEVKEVLKSPRFEFLPIGNLTELSEFPDINTQTQSDYENILRQEYVTTGDMEVAKKSAAQIFKRTYGVTKITGEPRVIKYPPEKYYSVPGISDEWMGEQVLDEVRKIDEYKEAKSEDVVVVPDTITARQAVPRGTPSYLLYMRSEAGGYNPLRNKEGALRRFYFDSYEANQKANSDIEKKKKEKIDQAKLIRNIDPMAAALARAQRYLQ